MRGVFGMTTKAVRARKLVAEVNVVNIGARRRVEKNWKFANGAIGKVDRWYRLNRPVCGADLPV